MPRSALPVRGKGLQVHWVTNILEKSHAKHLIKFKMSHRHNNTQDNSKTSCGFPTNSPIRDPTDGGMWFTSSIYYPRPL